MLELIITSFSLEFEEIFDAVLILISPPTFITRLSAPAADAHPSCCRPLVPGDFTCIVSCFHIWINPTRPHSRKVFTIQFQPSVLKTVEPSLVPDLSSIFAPSVLVRCVTELTLLQKQ